MDKELAELIEESKRKVAAMMPDELAAMHAEQRESFVRGELGWPKARYRWENGVKVYASYEDYCNG
jgi:hypothetical protein